MKKGLAHFGNVLVCTTLLMAQDILSIQSHTTSAK